MCLFSFSFVSAVDYFYYISKYIHRHIHCTYIHTYLRFCHVRYVDGVGDTNKENAGVFSLVQIC